MNGGSPMIFVIAEQYLCSLPFYSLKAVFFLHDFLVRYRGSKRAPGFQTLRSRVVFERDYHTNHLSSWLNTSFLPRKNRKEQFEGLISFWSAFIRSFRDQFDNLLSVCLNIKLFLWLCPSFQIMVLSKYEICIFIESVTLNISAYM